MNSKIVIRFIDVVIIILFIGFVYELHKKDRIIAYKDMQIKKLVELRKAEIEIKKDIKRMREMNRTLRKLFLNAEKTKVDKK